MKLFALITLAISATVSVIAAPTPVDVRIDRRQAACRDVMVFFARGTTEPGTLGTVIGPGLSRAVTRAVAGQTASVEGIAYAANVAGFLVGGDPAGARTMAAKVRDAASNCPNAKIFMSR